MKLPPIPYRKLLKVLAYLDYKPIRQKGSHLILENEKTQNKDIGVGLLREIINQIGITREEFLKILYEA